MTEQVYEGHEIGGIGGLMVRHWWPYGQLTRLLGQQSDIVSPEERLEICYRTIVDSSFLLGYTCIKLKLLSCKNNHSIIIIIINSIYSVKSPRKFKDIKARFDRYGTSITSRIGENLCNIVLFLAATDNQLLPNC